MKTVAKNVLDQVRQIARDSVEAVVKEPGKIGQSAASQVGVELPSVKSGKQESPDLTPQQVAEKKQQEQQRLKFFRKQISNLTPSPQVSSQEQAEESKQLGQRKENHLPEFTKAPGGLSKRGTVLLGRRKTKGSSEMLPKVNN